jgi:uncharacterized membrane protein YeaQ/YmgE (transglycosylase-associated protein family)
MECIYFIVMVLVLAAIGWVIDLVIPGKMPYGWLGGVVAAIIGGLIGGLLFPNFGPSITALGWTLWIIPAILGGIIFAVIVRFIMGMSGRRSV